VPDRPRPATPRSLPRPSRAAYGRSVATEPAPSPTDAGVGPDAATNPGLPRIDDDGANERLTLIEFTWVSRGRIQPVIFVTRRFLH